MDYQQIYDNLINRAQNRICDSDEYYETHHIIPRCMGGEDDPNNLVELTAPEHRTVHLCLVKIYPNNYALVKAAAMMFVANKTQGRSKNRMYEWLKKKHRTAMSISQAGSGNSQFGKVWIYLESLRITKKISKKDLQDHYLRGWKLGRVCDFDNIYQTCSICNVLFRSNIKKNTCSKECTTILHTTGRAYDGREEEFKKLYKELGSMNKTLKAMGFVGAAGQYYNWAKNLI